MERQEYEIILKKIVIVLSSTRFCNDIKRAKYQKWIAKLFNFCIIGGGFTAVRHSKKESYDYAFFYNYSNNNCNK